MKLVTNLGEIEIVSYLEYGNSEGVAVDIRTNEDINVVINTIIGATEVEIVNDGEGYTKSLDGFELQRVILDVKINAIEIQYRLLQE